MLKPFSKIQQTPTAQPHALLRGVRCRDVGLASPAENRDSAERRLRQRGSFQYDMGRECDIVGYQIGHERSPDRLSWLCVEIAIPSE